MTDRPPHSSPLARLGPVPRLLLSVSLGLLTGALGMAAAFAIQARIHMTTSVRAGATTYRISPPESLTGSVLAGGALLFVAALVVLWRPRSTPALHPPADVVRRRVLIGAAASLLIVCLAAPAAIALNRLPVVPGD